VKTEALYSMIRNWLGIGPEYAVQEVGLRSSLPHFLLPVGICIAIAFAAYLYSREARLSRGRRIFLTVLRSFSYALILCILFEPFVGLTKSLTIRRNLLVLVDRSASMSIADARKKPQDLADAALAMGKVNFPVPAEQEHLASAQRAMRVSAAALKVNRYDDARAAQLSAQQSLAAVKPDAQATAGGDAPAAFLRALQDLGKQQDDLCNATEQLEKDGALNEDRYRELRGTQEKILETAGAIASALRAAVVAVPDAVRGEVAAVPRYAMATNLLNQPGPKVFDRIGGDGGCTLKFFAFGEKLEPLGKSAAESVTMLGALQPTGMVTRAGAIEDAVAMQGGQPVAGVVLLTDGAFNEGADCLEVARKMKEQGVPLFPVGLGLKTPEDVGLRSLIVPDAIFPNDEVRARVQVFSYGYREAKATLRVLLDGGELAQAPVVLSGEPQFVDVPFKIPEGRGGSAKLTVSISEQPGEVSTVNNQIDRQVRIINQKIKVLYVEGRPRWEFRYLRVILQRDPRLDVKFLMTQGDQELPSASDSYIASYPEKPEEAFAYDLVILGDVPVWYFSKPQVERMVELVRERGGSLLMLAGDTYAPSSYVGSPLAEILPVNIVEGNATVGTNAYPVATERGKQTLALLDPSDKVSAAIWSVVRPLFRIPNLDGAKPAANVLLELPAGPDRPRAYPLVAWHYAGTGKAMYVGTDQMWRLRFKRGDQYHARFWGQAIQFLALSRLLGENKRVRIEVDRTELRAGERVEIHANVLNEFFSPVTAPDYTVQLGQFTNGAAGATNGQPSVLRAPVDVKLSAIPASPGLYQGYATLPKEGSYALQAAGLDAAFATTVHLTVASPNPEQREPAMQEDLLRSMADLSGGQYLQMSEWPALPGVPGGKERAVTEQKNMNVWDRWPPYALLVICFGLELFIRRRHHLV
jgi:hypothetical protein